MPLHSATAPTIESAIAMVESAWGVAPVRVDACAGGSDAHVQLWHPAYMRRGDMPGYVYANGQIEMHPDAPLYLRGGRARGRGGLAPLR